MIVDLYLKKLNIEKNKTNKLYEVSKVNVITEKVYKYYFDRGEISPDNIEIMIANIENYANELY